MPAKSHTSRKASKTRKHSAHSVPPSSGELKKTPKSVPSAGLKRSSVGRSGQQNVARVGWLVLLLAVIGVVALVYFATRSQNQANLNVLPLEITVAEAYEKYQTGAFFLDVREANEWEQGHIPNTTWIPLGELSSRLDEIPRDQEIVVVCRSGNRSQEGRDILLQNGFSAVSSMLGGVREWGNAGYPFEGTIP